MIEFGRLLHIISTLKQDLFIYFFVTYPQGSRFIPEYFAIFLMLQSPCVSVTWRDPVIAL